MRTLPGTPVSAVTRLIVAKKLKSKKTTTNADKEFIGMAHNASQAYIELANRAFKGDSTLSGENTELFQTLEDVGLNTSDRRSESLSLNID
jgi:hypothetical protein